MEQPPINDIAQDDHSATVPQPSVGKMLREARVRLGMSIANVVDQTKLAHRQIEALEADDFQRLPEIPFVRGFVRSYARVLHLDEQPLLAALPQVKEVSVQLSPASVEVPFPNANLSQRQNLIWLGAALFLSVVFAFAMWHYTPQLAKLEVVQVATPDASPVKTPDVPALAEVVVEPSITVESSAGALAPPVAQPQIPKAAPQAEAEKPPAVKPRISQAEAVKPAAQQGAQLKSPLLRLTFGEDSWTEIRGKDDQMLSSQVNLRGSELRLNGEAPFSLVIGHAASVRLYYRGKPIDLTPHINASSEVARLTLE